MAAPAAAAPAAPPESNCGMRWLVKMDDGVPGASPPKGPIYRSKYAKDKFPTLEGISTCWELFQYAVKNYPDNKYLGRRPIVDGKAGDFVWETYSEVDAKVKALASAYSAVGVKPTGRVGVYGVNSPEWFIAMEACNALSLYCVPLYDTLGAEAVEFIMNHAEVQVVVVQEAKLPQLLKALPKCKEFLKVVVSMGALSEENKKALEALSLEAYTWEEFLAKGKESPAEPVPPKPEDYCTIMYTSGTTGEPKGVLLSHQSLIASIAGLRAYCEINNVVFTKDDCYLSYLPLAHIFDRVGEEYMTFSGSSIGYWQGDVKLLTDDIGALKPTFFVGVPRIFDRIYAGVTSKVAEAGGLRKLLFDFGYSRKIGRLQGGAPLAHAAPIADMLVFSKIKARLGGRVRLIISGAAPLAAHVEEFLKVTMCCPVVQGYGLTETNAGSFISYADKYEQTGTVGPPLPSIEVRLESVPEMNYDALGEPGRGEVCIRGATLFSGYYKRDELTKEALDAEGWFHTGDVGEWQADGSLKIIDRKKNIFKLAQGEYVAVESLENVYGNCAATDQVWVYGNSFESQLVAVVVPNKEGLEAWAKSSGTPGTFEELCKTDAAKKYILEQLTDTGKKGKLKGFEIVKAVYLDSQPFDMERDLLTPTFKKKRPQLLKYYKEHVDAMYAALKASAPA